MLTDDERLDLAESIVGFAFNDRDLLKTALTHPSNLEGVSGAAEHYERLEFLGDAVLELLVTEHLFLRYPDLPEGQMTKVRAAFVSGKAISGVAAEAGLADAVLLGKGAEAIRAANQRSLLADLFEALLAAVYLERGLEGARALLFRLMSDEDIREAVVKSDDDPKNLLQELTQARDGSLPDYEIVSVGGPPHARVFRAEVRIANSVLGSGEGSSKKEAERRAAAAALAILADDQGGA